MDVTANSRKIVAFIKKYKFVILILLIGLLLLTIPTTNKATGVQENIKLIPTVENEIEENLENIPR